MNFRFLGIFASLLTICLSSNNFFSQQSLLDNSALQYSEDVRQLKDSQTYHSVIKKFLVFPNPILIDKSNGCSFGNLHVERFDKSISANQRVEFCEALQAVSAKLNSDWSPELRAEIFAMWQVLMNQNIKIRPMKVGFPRGIVAAAEAFTEQTNEFNASLYLRPERFRDKSFFLVFMHELRHVYDFYLLWKNKSSITEAELEKRGFRVMSKLYQEMPVKERFFRLPTFWDSDWRNLPAAEIEHRREEKINKWMKGNSFYKDLLVNPDQHRVGFSKGITVQKGIYNLIEDETDRENKEESLPLKLDIRQSKTEIPQNVRELSFTAEKANNPNNPDELLKAAIANEKNLFRKMDNFVYDQNMLLHCFKNQKVTESFEINSLIARTETGEVLNQVQETPNATRKSLPKCVLNMESIETDATETFWAAPYFDQMQIRFEHFTDLDGTRVARYTVQQPSIEKFKEIASQYPQIKNFKIFVGTIFVSVADAQVIKFFGTSFPQTTNSDSKKTFEYTAGYNATAVRGKLASGIWVTTLLNTVAVTYDKNKIKPFSYVVKYQNYRQATSDVRILDN